MRGFYVHILLNVSLTILLSRTTTSPMKTSKFASTPSQTETPTSSLLSLLLSSGNPRLSPKYAKKVLQLFTRVFELAYEFPNVSSWTSTPTPPMPPPPAPPTALLPPYAQGASCPTVLANLMKLCSSLTALADVETFRLTNWLSVIILGGDMETMDKEDAVASVLVSAAGPVSSPEDEMFSSASSFLAFIDKGTEARVSQSV